MNRAACSIEASFLDNGDRELFYLLMEPRGGTARGTILFLPPFAEEMNKSRRTVARQARELAAGGYRVMLLDLTGCGDSGGHFSDASWHQWLSDAGAAADLLSVPGSGPLYLWGLRLGGLLAAHLAQERADVHGLLLWQPVLNGEQQVDQFLRLSTVASAVSGVTSFDRKSLWDELRAGRSLEIAGYDLSSSLALEMARVRLHDLNPGCRVGWLEIGLSPDARLSLPSDSVIAHWRDQGLEVESVCVRGDTFWRNVDSDINDALLSQTTQLMCRQ